MTNTMTKTKTMIKRKVHPARRARTITALTSTTGFLAVISSFAWNTQLVQSADLAAVNSLLPVPTSNATTPALTPLAAVPTSKPVAAPTISATPTVAPSKKATGGSGTVPTQTIAPAVPAVPADATTTPAAAPATPVVAPATPVVAPTTPVAPVVVYTCMSPGGRTESPTASGSCQNARYGYVLTQI